MITFMTTLYNEQHEVEDLINHVYDYVDDLVIVDDGSTDTTLTILESISNYSAKLRAIPIAHTGVCELGRIEALQRVKAGSWVILLDADERFAPGVLQNITEYIADKEKFPEIDSTITHIYFNQLEYIDNQQTRSFQKPKVFLKESIHLPTLIHGDPGFDGDPISFGWNVIHRKSSTKQLVREKEYIEVYRKLVEDGLIDEGKKKWFESMHYYVRDDIVPHG